MGLPNGSDILEILDVNLNTRTNGIQHHTSNYAEMRRMDPFLVVRRGQGFVIGLEISRAYDANTDEVVLNLTLKGKDDRTIIISHKLPLKQSSDSTNKDWKATIVNSDESLLTIEIVPSCNAVIGKWGLEVETKLSGSSKSKLNTPDTFYLLFNPWCTDDTVYLSDENKRQEYVLEPYGKIWQKSKNGMEASIDWHYDQFEEYILDCALYILTQMPQFDCMEQNNPVIVTRALSSAINGYPCVLVGRWAEDVNDYNDGKRPGYWTGSKEILQQFYHTQRPVKYGQCWVFGGIFTTLCRTLGIPSRVITNYGSAHDTDGNGIIDVYYENRNGSWKIINESDMVWNFHVWIEAWMTRPDIGKDYDGWQAVDATPQEASNESKYNGLMCCGPTSVAAIKRAEIKLPYDCPFVFSEVNTREVHWNKQGDNLKFVYALSNGIGYHISTKAVGNVTREDVTHAYKDVDYYEAQRKLISTLRQRKVTSPFGDMYLKDLELDTYEISITLNAPTQKIIGETFSFTICVTNTSVENKLITLSTTVYLLDNMGKTRTVVKKIEPAKLSILGSQIDELEYDITWDDYGSILTSEDTFMIECFATVDDTDNDYIFKERYSLASPSIKFTMDDHVFLHKKFPVTASFTNPLPVTIEKGTFYITAPGLNRKLEIELTDPVKSGEEVVCKFVLSPNKVGRQLIIVKFETETHLSFSGSRFMTVKRKNNGRPYREYSYM